MPKTNGKWTDLTAEETQATAKGRPVDDFPIEFEWHTGPWQDIFDEQITLVKEDIARAKAQDRIIVYLSCPITSRGGGWSGTNVDVARFTERRLLQEWGEAFWILNPTQYQLESKAGTGLIERHARKLGIDLTKLRKLADASGGDYLRMWTRLLVENNEQPKAPKNSGQSFDAFYFLGPGDVHTFFTRGGDSLTAGIQAYFARRFANDPDFCDAFSVPGINWGTKPPIDPMAPENLNRSDWERRRFEFLRFYGVRASVNFSLGSHDEWSIFRLINKRRRLADSGPGKLDGDVGVQTAGFFDGRQIDPASTEAPLTRGYALSVD